MDPKVTRVMGKHKRLALFVCLILIMCDYGSTASRKINCRRYVHAPECRGIAAKRDTSEHAVEDQYRLSSEESGSEMVTDAGKNLFLLHHLLNDEGPLWKLLRKAAERNPEYDTGTFGRNYEK